MLTALSVLYPAAQFRLQHISKMQIEKSFIPSSPNAVAKTISYLILFLLHFLFHPLSDPH